MAHNLQEKVTQITKAALDHDRWLAAEVAKHEEASKRHPAAYHRKVVRFSKLMPLFVVGMIFLTVALLVATILLLLSRQIRGSVVLYVLVFAGFFLYAMLRSIFFKIPAPQGISVSRADAPELWALIDGATKATGAPLPKEVLIDLDLNASAVQRRAWGLFGPVKSTLILGLPLMASLTKDEFDFVVAHEFGHFAGEPGANGGEVYWQYKAMENLQASIDDGFGRLVFGKFLQWYFPRFQSLSFVLRRQQEYEADAAAARLAGASQLKGLLRLALAAVRMDECYESWTTMITSGRPKPASQTRDLMAALNVPASWDKERSALRALLTSPTTYADTHPSYRDRAGALGVEVAELEESLEAARQPIKVTAATIYLDKCLPKLTPGFDEVYLLNWESAQDRATEAEDRIRELEVNAKTVDEQVELAMTKLGSRLISEPEAFNQVQELTVRHPENALAHLALGRLLADRIDEAGEHHMRKAMELNPDFTEAAVDAIGGLRARLGRHDFEDLKEASFQHHARQSLIEEETMTVGLDTAFVPHQLSDDDLTTLRKIVVLYPLRGAYVFGKRLSSGKVVNYLLVIPKGIAISQNKGVNVLNKMITEHPELPDVAPFAATEKFGAWEKKLRAIPGAQIMP